LELRNLTTFVRAAELRSFSQAARQLGYSQSAVSMQISQLETELETSLFDRIGKTIALTPQGATFYEYAQNILRMTENARTTMKNSSMISGQLRIAMAESICMSIFPNVLSKFCSKYPDVQVTIQSDTTGEMFRALSQNDVDMVYQLDNQIYRPDLMIPFIQATPIIFVASADHPLADRKDMAIEECIKYPFILTEKGMSYRSQLDNHLARMELSIDPFLEIGNTEVIISLLKNNSTWISFIPEFVARESIDRGEIARLDVFGIDIELYRQLIYHKGKWITPAMQAMIELISNEDNAEK